MSRMNFRRAATFSGAGVLAAAACAALTGTASAAAVATDGGPSGGVECTTGLGELTPDAVARATDAALDELAVRFPNRDVTDAYVTGATRSDSGPVGRELIDECGARVQGKAVIVDFVFPAMLPDADLTYGAAVVSPINGQYSVWRTQ